MITRLKHNRICSMMGIIGQKNIKKSRLLPKAGYSITSRKMIWKRIGQKSGIYARCCPQLKKILGIKKEFFVVCCPNQLNKRANKKKPWAVKRKKSRLLPKADSATPQ